jgi:hypothetical protein
VLAGGCSGRLREAWPAASNSVGHWLPQQIGWRASRRARVGGHVERVGIVSAQEVQGKDGNYHDQHYDGHKDNQDRSDHHTIPLKWPWGGASKTRAATAQASPERASTLQLLRLTRLNSDCVGRYTPCHAIREVLPRVWPESAHLITES